MFNIQLAEAMQNESVPAIDEAIREIVRQELRRAGLMPMIAPCVPSTDYMEPGAARGKTTSP